MPTIFDNKDNAWKLKTLGWAQSRAEIMRAELEDKIKEVDKKQLELYGNPTSMFYGLICPGKYKCIRYIGEEYNISPDITRTLQDLIIKKNYENNIQKYFKLYKSVAARDGRRYRLPNRPTDHCQKPRNEIGNPITCLRKFQPQGNQWESRPIMRRRNYCVEGRLGWTGLKLGGIVFVTNLGYDDLDAPVGEWCLNPVLKRTRDNGYRYDGDLGIEVIDKKTLYEACVNNCRYGDLVSMKMNKKELFAHLLKYG